MKCTLFDCPKKAPSKWPVWSKADTDAARAAGWFIWDERAPVWFLHQEIEGMVFCPEHRATARGKRLEALHDESLKPEVR